MEKPHQSDLRKGRMSIPWHAYSVTKRKDADAPFYLTDHEQFATKLIELFFFYQKQKHIDLGAFVVMPDHYHILFRLLDKKTLAQVIHSINSFMANHARKMLHLIGSLWQDGYYDHAIRNEESLIKQAKYIEANPVRMCLVDNSDQWPYSSAYKKWADMVDRSWF